VTKVPSHVMLVLYNVMMVPSNVRKKNKRNTECKKNIVTCNIGITQYEDDTIECEKKEGNYRM